MSVCTFFGHRDCPDELKIQLRSILIELIENHAAESFYVGNQGKFDSMAHSILRELQAVYPGIRYAVVLAYLPQKKEKYGSDDFSNTIFPDGMENVPKRFAIVRRNQWMLRQSDIVVTYIRHSWGGAAQFAELAERQKKMIIRL